MSDIDHKNAVDYLLNKIQAMRKAQRDYFARKQDTDKRLAIRLEKEVDDLILRYKARGYNGDRFNEKAEQATLL
jgi:hypothetical protein